MSSGSAPVATARDTERVRISTLLPSEAWNVAGVEGDHYTVGPFCDAPGCRRTVDHKHHLWRRSFLGGDFWWVRVPLPDEATTTIRNVVGLCYHHHDDVTGAVGGHRAWIRWVPEDGVFYWLESDGYDHWTSIGTLSLPAPLEPPVPPGGREAERCPTCGRVKHREHEQHEPSPKRPKKTWTISVPADAEDGAAILDELVEIIAETIGAEEHTSRLKRYHVVLPALVWVVQNSDEFARDFYDESRTETA